VRLLEGAVNRGRGGLLYYSTVDDKNVMWKNKYKCK